MRRLLDAIRKSFSARLSIWVVLFAAMIYLIAGKLELAVSAPF